MFNCSGWFHFSIVLYSSFSASCYCNYSIFVDLIELIYATVASSSCPLAVHDMLGWGTTTDSNVITTPNNEFILWPIFNKSLNSCFELCTHYSGWVYILCTVLVGGFTLSYIFCVQYLLEASIEVFYFVYSTCWRLHFKLYIVCTVLVGGFTLSFIFCVQYLLEVSIEVIYFVYSTCWRLHFKLYILCTVLVGGFTLSFIFCVQYLLEASL